ncbi:MAG: TackOD1 domain-containing metal-binding protein [Candidatus Thorarchaeota archaeon]
MPKAIFSIWWDDTLGPMVGRSFPEEDPITGEEALSIFMGHGVNQEAKMGYTKLKRGLIISYMQAPNCIAVQLAPDDDSAIVERNLQRLVKDIDMDSDNWDAELTNAFSRLQLLIKESSGPELLANPGVARLVQEMHEGRIGHLAPKHILHGTVQYPDASEYLGDDYDETRRTLTDLVDAGVLVPKTYGRRVLCRQCGGEDVQITLLCPNCNSQKLHKVYTVHCPRCKEQTPTVIEDHLTEVRCVQCKADMEVSDLNVLDVEPVCEECGTASNEPKIAFACASCGKHLDGVDLLSGTGLAYYHAKQGDKEIK